MKIFDMAILLAVLFVCTSLSGCAGRVDPVTGSSVVLPAAFSQSGTTKLAGKWWLAFDDEGLNAIIEQALSGNFSLQSSWSRLSQAEALYRKSRATLFPALDAEGSGGHTAERTGGTMVKTDRLLLGLSISYEMDLWGKIDSEVAAARLDMEATAADLDAAAMTLAAAVATTWYDLVEQAASLDLLEEQIQTNSMALELITTRFRTGQVPIADVLQQRQLIETQKGERVQLLSRVGQNKHKLAILLGRLPGSEMATVPSQLIDLPELPSTGIPAELIRSRPDIRSSLLSLQSADERVAAAVADQYPSLRLTAYLETVESPATVMFSDYLASIAAGLTAPLFDGGLRKAEVDRTRAVAEERLHNYAQTVLTAVGEVEDALLLERQQQHYLQSLQAQLDLATQTMEQVKERYLKGVENYQRVLTALTSLQSLQQSRLAVQKDLLLNRIELCRALGRGWEYSQTDRNS